MGLNGRRQRKRRFWDVLPKSGLVGSISFSLLERGWDVQLSHTSFSPVQVSSDMVCLIEYKEIGRFPCQFCDQSAGTFFGSQGKLNDSVSLNLFDLVDACSLQVSAEKLTEGWRCRWILEGRRGDVEPAGFRMA
jgi:hypothetical protein